MPCLEAEREQDSRDLDFPGGAVAGTSLPVQGAWVRPLVREADGTYHNYRFQVTQLRPSTAKQKTI